MSLNAAAAFAYADDNTVAFDAAPALVAPQTSQRG